MRILLTRPEAEAQRMRAMLEARNHSVIVEPLMRVVYLPEALESLEGVNALVATSRNGIRALQSSRQIDAALRLPLFTVGAGTAEEAHRAGFKEIIVGPGTASGLAAHIASRIEPLDGLIVHLAGDVLAADLAGMLEQHGFRTLTAVVYRMEEAEELSEKARAALIGNGVDVVILMSARTAAIYVRLLTRHHLTERARTVHHLCLSAAVARSLAPLAPVPLAMAEAPSLAAILTLIDRLSLRLNS